MCFSATASFAAGAGLLVVGAITLRQARRRAEMPFAAIPLLFGIQQLIEGALWLTFPDKAPMLKFIQRMLTRSFHTCSGPFLCQSRFCCWSLCSGAVRC